MTVPRSALATFTAGEAVTISAGFVNVTPIVASDYAVDLEAAQNTEVSATITP